MRKRKTKKDRNAITSGMSKNNIVRALFYLNAVLWLIYTIYIYFDMAVVNHNELSADITTIFVFVNAILMLVSGIALGKYQKPTFYFALIVAVPNFILTLLNLTDVFFLAAFIIDLIILILLLQLHMDYLSRS